MLPARGTRRHFNPDANPVHILFVIPGEIDLPTGGYRYDRAMIGELREMGHRVDLLSLSGSYPFPSESEKLDALKQLETVSGPDLAIVDGLAGGAHPQLLKHLSDKLPTISLIHHPLCLETGLDRQSAGQLEKSERDGLGFVTGIACSSPETVKTVKSLFPIEGKPVGCFIPGIEPASLSKPQSDNPVKLLCVGSVIQRKGHVHLIEALAVLRDLDWHLDCVGKIDFEPDLFNKLNCRVSDYGLSGKVQFHGSVHQEELEKFYSTSHFFVLPSLYEGYGMVYAEAISRGLPVIGTTAGAIPDTVPDGCGILVEPGNVDDLTDALRTMISEPHLRATYRQSAITAAENYPTWRKSAQGFAAFLEQIK